MSLGDIRTEQQARAALGLGADDPPSTWRAAFQRRVKTCHPDQGGNDDKVRLIIEAYQFLKTTEGSARRGQRMEAGPRAEPRRPTPRPKPKAAAPPPPEPEPDDPVVAPDARCRISIVEAFKGAEKTFRMEAGKRFKVRLPTGLQDGDLVRFGPKGEHRLTIQVAPLKGAALKGADLWLTIKVSTEFLKEGGRMEIEHPLGPRRFWVSRTSVARGVFRAPGEGLPARPNRARGHLYLKFEHDPELDTKPLRSLLARFAKAWASV